MMNENTVLDSPLVSIDRDFVGVHWHSDSIEGMLLDEEFAINVLRDLKLGYYEEFKGFNLPNLME